MDEHGKERLELAEYRLSDRVETRVVNNLRKYSYVVGASFVVGLTAFGFFGIPSFQHSVSQEVTEKLSDQITRDTKGLHDRLAADMDAIAITKAELDSKVKDAQTELESLQQGTNNLKRILEEYKGIEERVQQTGGRVEQMRTSQDKQIESIRGEFANKFNNLQKSLVTVSQDVSSAMVLATSTSVTAENLQGALSSSSRGLPAIFAVPKSFQTGKITGNKFGNTKGTVLMRPRLRSTSTIEVPQGIKRDELLGSINRISVPTEDIESWSDTEVQIRSDDETKNVMLKFVLEAILARGIRVAESDLEFGYQIETAGHQDSDWFYETFVPSVKPPTGLSTVVQ